MDEDMEDGIKFSIGEDGTLTKYEEPYTTIECKTEEDYNRLSRLLELGKNADKLNSIKNCKYCDEDRLINQSAVRLIKKGSIACINDKDEFVVNIEGNQANIPIKFCPWCGNKL